METNPHADGEVERFTVVMDDDGLPVIRTASGIITSEVVKEIESLSR